MTITRRFKLAANAKGHADVFFYELKMYGNQRIIKINPIKLIANKRFGYCELILSLKASIEIPANPMITIFNGARR